MKNRINKLFIGLCAFVLCVVACNNSNDESKKDSSGRNDTTSALSPSSIDTNSSSDNRVNSSQSGSSSNGQNTSSNHNSSSDNGEGGEGNVISVPAGLSDWPEAAKKLMRDHIYGQVLPYIDIDTMVVYYENADYLDIMGGTVSGDDLANYAAKFVGWDMLDASSQLGKPNGSYYFGEKKVQTSAGLRVASVEFTAISGDDFGKNGTFHLMAKDNYVYSFPSQFVNSLISSYQSNISFPNVNADYYAVIEDENAICCYYSSALEDGGFTQILRSVNWAIESNKDNDGYYVAHSPDEKVKIRYVYSNGVLEIIFNKDAGWPTTAINALFAKYGYEGFDIPKLEDTNANYVLEEGAYNASMPGYENATLTISPLSQTKFQSYSNILISNGWTIEGSYPSYNAYKETNNGTANIYVSYTPSGYFNGEYSPSYAEIMFNLKKLNEGNTGWPAIAIANYLNVQYDTVPAHNGASGGYETSLASSYLNVIINCGTGNEASTAENYVASLVAANWTKNGTVSGFDRYLSPHNEIAVTVGYNVSVYPGQVFIQVQKYSATVASWPTDRVNSNLRNIGVSENLLPALENEHITEFKIYSDYQTSYSFNITCQTDSGLSIYDKEDIIEAYVELLEQSNFEYSYYSPSGLDNSTKEINVDVGLDSRSRITIYVATYRGEWPSEDLSEFYDDNLIGPSDQIPQLFGPKSFALGQVTEGIFTLTGTLFTTDAASEIMNDYRSSLVRDNNFVFDYDASYADTRNADGLNYLHYSSPNDKLALCIYKNNKDIVIEFRVISSSVDPVEPTTSKEWPLASIKSLFPATLGVPTLSIENAEYYFDADNSFSGFAFVMIVIEGKSKQQVVDIAAVALEAVGYEYDSESFCYIKSGYVAVGFFSPVDGAENCYLAFFDPELM